MLKDEKNVEHVVIIRDQGESCDALVAERFKNTTVDPAVQDRLAHLCKTAIREATFDQIASSGICESEVIQEHKREKRFIIGFLIGFVVASVISYYIGVDNIEAVAIKACQQRTAGHQEAKSVVEQRCDSDIESSDKRRRTSEAITISCCRYACSDRNGARLQNGNSPKCHTA